MGNEDIVRARAVLDAAVRQYVAVLAADRGREGIVVIGWAGYAEYTSVALESEDQTATATLIPDGQYRGTSLGLMTMGAQAFT